MQWENIRKTSEMQAHSMKYNLNVVDIEVENSGTSIKNSFIKILGKRVTLYSIIFIG